MLPRVRLGNDLPFDCRSAADGDVVTHNRFGRVYMLPVGQARKPIVNSNLRYLRQKLEERVRAAPA